LGIPAKSKIYNLKSSLEKIRIESIGSHSYDLYSSNVQIRKKKVKEKEQAIANYVSMTIRRKYCYFSSFEKRSSPRNSWTQYFARQMVEVFIVVWCSKKYLNQDLAD